uniref:Uncharacterized protein n=1 Tax=Phenylobacterium glaciei TaxID=2803784 RepID=A0A974P1H0_9CAUL|nr:hypothetical protein JKL49_18955 [Phenylobacterium glaciei]
MTRDIRHGARYIHTNMALKRKFAEPDIGLMIGDWGAAFARERTTATVHVMRAGPPDGMSVKWTVTVFF